jgi:2-polyprenyl-3-methyl-5-hydroxy-6-metoxy-1,4-benzoquinol methylase
MTQRFIQALIEKAAAPYRAAGRFAWNFARGKLGGDPVFAGLLEHGLIPYDARILDIGCGQGLLASWLLCARTMHDSGHWPAHWPAAPRLRAIHGIELMPRDVERAQRALASHADAATFTAGDMCKTEFGQADVVVILDVLHYVSIAAQDDVLLRVRNALSPKGVLLLRVGDASAGLAFKMSVWVDHVVTFVRGHRNARLYCRPLADWRATLTGLGFSVSTMAMNKGTPFANVLLIAKLGQDTHAQ